MLAVTAGTTLNVPRTPAVRIAVANFSLGSSSDPGATVKAAFDHTCASGGPPERDSQGIGDARTPLAH